MMGARIVTTNRELEAEELLCSRLKPSSVLAPGELIKEIRVPQAKGVFSYDKNRVRDAIDFANVALASRLVVEDGLIKSARIVFGAVAPIPLRRPEVEAFLIGKAPSDQTADQAAELCVQGAVPMAKNESKLFVMKFLLKRAILRLK
jgi:CO/xanthine dehydrogenase FAD-binding subunit